MSERRFGKIRRTEFERRQDEFQTEQTRCAIGLRIPSEFRSLREDCMPDHTQACNFEKITVEEVDDDSERVAEREGWTKLGCGVGRCTYLWKPRCVVKFARSGRRDGKEIGAGSFWGVTGEDSNTYEVASYNLADDNVKKFLNPIVAHSPDSVAHGYTWIVQPRVRTIHNDSLGRTRIHNIRDEVDNGLELNGAHCEDIHEENVGLLLNKYPVLIDYGFSVRCKRVPKVERPKDVGGLTKFLPTTGAREIAKARRALSLIKTKHRGRHGLKRPRGAGVPMGVLTRRRRLLWAEAGALRRKAKDFTDPDIRERMIADARFLEQQAWRFQTKLARFGDKFNLTGKNLEQVLGLLNQTRKEQFLHV